MDAPTLEHALHARAADILERCTACGICAEICPMPGPAGLDTTNPQALTAGILTLLRAAPTPRPAAGPRSAPAAATASRPARTA
jgi:heterodisulfide reductase subunit D